MTTIPRPDRIVASTLAGMCLALAMAGCGRQEAPVIPSTEPVAVDTPPPAFPEGFACGDASRKVVLVLTIGTDGRPARIGVVEGSGVEVLDKAAEDAVHGWRFKPATSNGRPVPVEIQVPVTFNPPAVKPESCYSGPAG